MPVIPHFLRRLVVSDPVRVIDPASLSNLELRLDAAAIVSASTPPFGDPLATWPDTSGNVGRDASQANVAQQPNYVNFDPSGPHGEILPCVFFNNANNDLYHGALPANMDASNGATYYLWMRTFGAPGGISGQVPYCDETGGRPRLYWNDGTGGTNTQAVGWGDALITHAITPTPLESWYSVVWVFNPPPGSGKCRLYINGVFMGEDTWSHANNGTGYWVGSIQSGGMNLRARIFEFLWYSEAHSDPTRIGISRYMRQKWGF